MGQKAKIEGILMFCAQILKKVTLFYIVAAMQRFHQLALLLQAAPSASSASAFSTLGCVRNPLRRYCRHNSSFNSRSLSSPPGTSQVKKSKRLTHHSISSGDSLSSGSSLAVSTINTAASGGKTPVDPMTQNSFEFSGSPEFKFQNADIGLNVATNGLYHFELKRSNQLNALNFDMVTSLSEAFFFLRQYDSCKAIVITGEGEKAFCAGGDVRMLATGETSAAQNFFSREYLMDYLTSRLGKPYLSIWKGIVMGGGVGLSLHGTYRIATDSTHFAMPETAIGLFPDVGASHTLSRLKGGLGLYLGLTGARMNATDVFMHGLATHFIPQANLENFLHALKKSDFQATSTPFETVDALLMRYGCTPPSYLPAALDEKTLESIDQIFGNVETLTALLQRLEASKNDPFSKSTLKILSTKCPLSCAVWFHQYKLGKNMTLPEVFRMEFNLAQSFSCFDPNFKEGVRARLIEKDNTPTWTPSTFSSVTEEHIQRVFACPEGKPLEYFVDLEA